MTPEMARPPGRLGPADRMWGVDAETRRRNDHRQRHRPRRLPRLRPPRELELGRIDGPLGEAAPPSRTLSWTCSRSAATRTSSAYLERLRAAAGRSSRSANRDGADAGRAAGGRGGDARTRCAAASTSSTRRRSSTAAGAATPTSCSASNGRAASAPGATTSPTRSSPARSRPARCSRSASTPTCSRLQGVAPERLTSSPATEHAHLRLDDFARVLPPRQAALRGPGLRRPDGRRRRDLSRPGRPLPGLRLVPDLHGPAPRGRPPVDRGRDEPDRNRARSSRPGSRPAGRSAQPAPAGDRPTQRRGRSTGCARRPASRSPGEDRRRSSTS